MFLMTLDMVCRNQAPKFSDGRMRRWEQYAVNAVQEVTKDGEFVRSERNVEHGVHVQQIRNWNTELHRKCFGRLS